MKGRLPISAQSTVALRVRLNIYSRITTAEEGLQNGVHKARVPQIAEARKRIVRTMTDTAENCTVLLCIFWHETPQSRMFPKSAVLSLLQRQSLHMQHMVMALGRIMPLRKEVALRPLQILNR